MATKVFFILFFLLPCVFTHLLYTEGGCTYYWTEYDGPIPEDAIPGGKDSHGKIFYVGLVHFNILGGSFAGMIIPSTKSAWTSYMRVNKNVKNGLLTTVYILRSPDPEGFEWVPTSSDELHLMTNRTLVPGGTYAGNRLYIGRVRDHGGLVLGKVYTSSYVLRGLLVPSSHGLAKQYLSFEVLTFSCKRKNDTEIDVRNGPADKF